MSYQSEQEIIDLVTGFTDCTLPKARWTHKAHLTVGIWFHKMHGEFEAISYLRSGIISYNVASGGKNTPEEGYHETLTLFWSGVIRGFVLDNNHLHLVELCNKFLGTSLSSKELPFSYYSKEILFTTKARALWVDPDIKKLR